MLASLISLLKPPRDSVSPNQPSVRGQVARIAWPVVVENLLQTMLGLVNLWMVSRLGVEVMAGVGNALQYVQVGISAFGAIGVGSTVLIAHSIGSGDQRMAERFAKQSLLLGSFLAVALSVLGWRYAYEANLLLGVTPDVAEVGARYLRITSIMLIGLLLMFVSGAIFRGTGDSRTPMLMTLVANLMSAGLTYWFIFGGLGLPALGVEGAALGSSLSRLFGAAVLIWLLVSGRRRIRLVGREGWSPNRRLMSRILSIGVPSSVESMLISGGFLLLTIVVALMGTQVLAAHRVVLQVMSMSAMVSIGFGVAATTLTGMHMGAKRPEIAERSTWSAMQLGMLCNVALVAAFLLLGDAIMRLFAPNDPEVVRVGDETIKVVAAAQPFFTVANVLAGSLRGAGDTRFPMYTAALGMWLIRLPGAYLLGITFGWGLAGVYAATVIDAAVRSVIYLRRYRARNWQRLDVMKGLRSKDARAPADAVPDTVSDFVSREAPATVPTKDEKP